MKYLLHLCTRNAHVSLDGKLYVQNDRAAMGSSLASLSVNIFVVELEQIIFPVLEDRVKKTTLMTPSHLLKLKLLVLFDQFRTIFTQT